MNISPLQIVISIGNNLHNKNNSSKCTPSDSGNEERAMNRQSILSSGERGEIQLLLLKRKNQNQVILLLLIIKAEITNN